MHDGMRKLNGQKSTADDGNFGDLIFVSINSDSIELFSQLHCIELYCGVVYCIDDSSEFSH